MIYYFYRHSRIDSKGCSRSLSVT